jgi:hypothetical protein
MGMQSEQFKTKSELVEAVAEMWGYFCFLPICQGDFTEEDPASLDHWRPLSKGGTWDISNLRLMHRRCNAIKSDTLPINEYEVIIKDRAPRARRRADKRSGRPIVCSLCESGRLLLPGEECGLCGSGPQPATAPRTLQTSPSECNHSTFHCRECFVENPSLRDGATMSLIIGN